MNRSPEFEINESFYEWCVRAFSLLRRRLGINIKVHDADGHIKDGQIFLFNHFARIETVIPQYFIHQATGAYCRCVAAHDLFAKNDRFARLLWSCGAVPNNYPGLLPFLAAEILRGRKVIFFPEGSMIKDRRVSADGPALDRRSTAQREQRKHRQGAAALAFVLEVFKKRILSVNEAGDVERLNRWVAALGLKDRDALIAAARLPTLIVPANITFFPIHTGDNILSKAAEFFAGELETRMKDELLVEGNLVLRRTDMDIRFGKPIHPHITWNVFDRLLIGRIFEGIDSLEQLFALRDRAGRWIERMVNMRMKRRVEHLRDLCMDEMYGRVTVNLAHFASRLVTLLYGRGETVISRDRFHRLLYLAFKHAETEPSLHLHRSLLDPELYGGIHDGSSPLVADFIATAAASGLIEVDGERYLFKPRLRQENGGRDPRLENVVLVYANEIAPVAAARRAVDRALADEPKDGSATIARGLFDDEMRAYQRACARASPHLEPTAPGASAGAPYLLLPEGRSRLGVVLVHDFLASPAELRPFGDALVAAGYAVMGVRLSGHGTSPGDLRDRSWRDWLKSVRRGQEILSLLSDRVCVVGFGLGGVLALRLAADDPPGLAGVASVCAPVKFRNRSLAFVPVLHGLNRLTEWTGKEEGLVPFRSNSPEHPDVSYASVPIRALLELRRAIDEMDRRLPDIRSPATILQASDDPEVDPDSARHIHDRLGSNRKSVHYVVAERHGILRDDIADTRSRLLSFLARASDPLPGAAAPAAAEAAAARRRLALPETMLRPFRFLKARPPSTVDRPHPWEKSYPPDLDWRAVIPPRPLTALFDEAVKAFADRPSMSFRGKSYRYRDLGRHVDRTARGLQGLGVTRGTKVALLLPNCPYAVICFHAVLKAGGIVVNINPLYAKYEIERQLVDSGARILFTLDLKGLYDKVDDLARDGGPLDKLVVCPMRGVLRFREKVMFGLLKASEIAAVVEDDRHLPFYRLLDNDGAVTPPDIDPATEVAVLQYTGGTTGMPKGAQLTHANLNANVVQLLMWAPDVVRGHEKSLAVLPLFHSFGMTAVMNMSLAIGAEIILQPRFQTRDVLEAIARERATILIGVPTMFSALNAMRDIGRYDLKSLKFCISGGAPLPATVQSRFETLSGCRLLEGYGLSEASPVCTINPLSGGKPGSVGLPLPGTTVEIVALDDPDRLLGIDMRGEICISGPQVMSGYANRAEENVDIFRGTRLHTGDVGYLDEDGYLFIVDRIKDLILSGGFNVYPRQVEEIIHQHPAVEEVAVCGIADLHRGEIVKAFVKTRDGMRLTSGELKAFCKERLAPFQTPREVEFRDTLPKTLIGKIDKKQLLAEVRNSGADTPDRPARQLG
ncbi:MAG TPA: AMP-binding protein [Allosphingosinicella sp.]|nr:AMP-binding protein [Allosphingosinicella sp.]